MSAVLPKPGLLGRDLTAGLVVFLIALTLCLGVALAANAPLFSGILAGIIGGIVVGGLSGSQTSVSGPSPALTAIIAAQIALLGSFELFLLALLIAGLIQMALGIARLGFIAAFVPSTVIQGLLAAIGLILILKQIPHVLGHDADPEGNMSFRQPDQENTFSELGELLGHIHPGAAVIGLLSLAVLFLWEKIPHLRKSIIPAPLLVVLLSVGLSLIFYRWGGNWRIGASHLVQVPVPKSWGDTLSFLRHPDFTAWANPVVLRCAVMLAIVATLESLLNLEAVDKIDPEHRVSPPNRELLAQGVGNVTAGLLGGIPISSVIVRSSVNINAGAATKLSTITHGVLLLSCVMLLPTTLNLVPISCLAAILLATGVKLFNPKVIARICRDGFYRAAPFLVTLVATVLTDLVTGVLVGLAVSIAFVLNSNLRRPLRRIVEKHLSGEVLHIELANQVSFMNRAAIDRVLDDVPRGGHVLFDAHATDYIDPDVLGLIREYKEVIAPVRGVQVSLSGFRKKYHIRDDIQYVDYSTRELQDQLSWEQVLKILQEGNERFRTGQRLTRDFGRQLHATAAEGQHPLAAVLTCIDSRTPSELIFDLGIGDIFSVRVAGNVISEKVLGSLEYSSAVAGAKLILVLGHTQCGAVMAAVNLARTGEDPAAATGCQHLGSIVGEIQCSIQPGQAEKLPQLAKLEQAALINRVAIRNVQRSVQQILEQSDTIRNLVAQGRVQVLGALYEISTGEIDFLDDIALETAAAEGPAEFSRR